MLLLAGALVATYARVLPCLHAGGLKAREVVVPTFTGQTVNDAPTLARDRADAAVEELRRADRRCRPASRRAGAGGRRAARRQRSVQGVG